MHPSVLPYLIGALLTVFPHDLKLSEITPAYKKNDNMYSSQIFLLTVPIVSKLVDKVITSQFMVYFSNLHSTLLIAVSMTF